MEDPVHLEIKIKRKLGEGAFGIVYYGEVVKAGNGGDLENPVEDSGCWDGRQVAVKKCHYSDEEGRKRIQQEISSYKLFKKCGDYDDNDDGQFLVQLLTMIHDIENQDFYLAFPFYEVN